MDKALPTSKENLYTLINIEQKKKKKVLKWTGSIVALKELFNKEFYSSKSNWNFIESSPKRQAIWRLREQHLAVTWFPSTKRMMFQGEEGENIKHEIISKIKSADEWTYKINVEQNTLFCESTPFYPPTPTLFDTSTASTENHRTGQDACAAEALLQIKFQSTFTNIPTMNAKEKWEPSYTKMNLFKTKGRKYMCI